MLLESQPDWEICAQASSGREAVKLCKQFSPDVVVLDIGMPSLNGLDAARQIKKVRPDTEIAIITGLDSDQLLQDSLVAGVRAYLFKSEAGTHLVSAIEALARHEPYFNAHLPKAVFERYCAAQEAGRGPEPIEVLTAREREVVQLVAEGNTNKQIAVILGISSRTVEVHRSSLMEKLGVRSVSDVVHYAIRNRMVIRVEPDLLA